MELGDADWGHDAAALVVGMACGDWQDRGFAGLGDDKRTA